MLLRLVSLATRAWLRLLGFRRLTRTLGDWRLVYYRKGREGEPWVLLHGIGSTGLSWRPVARYLAPGNRVLIPELSALGGTRGPAPALDVREAARVIAELLRREFAGEPATVVGLSLGGWMAVQLALQSPELVSRLLLIDAGGYRDQDWEGIRELVTVRSRSDVDRLYAALFHRVPYLFRLSRKAFQRVFSSPVVTHLLAHLEEGDLFGPEELARLDVPVGVIWADGDGLFSPAIGKQMAQQVRHGTFRLVPSVGHALHWEAPARLIAAIEEIRRELPLRPASPPPRS